MNNLSNFLWVSAVSMTLLYLIYYLFLRKETFFGLNRTFLLLSLGVSVVIPVAGFRELLNTGDGSSGSAILLDTIQVGLNNIDSGIRYAWYEQLPFATIIYLSGAAVFSFIFFRRFFSGIRLIRSGEQYRYDQNGIKCKLVITKKASGPCSVLNHVILPAYPDNSAALHNILRHEISHIRKGHTIDLIFLEMVSILQWFNPVIRLYKSSMREIHEYQADNSVLRLGARQDEYLQLLVTHIINFRPLKLSNSFNQSIKKRITMMKKSRSSKRAMVKAAMLMPLILLIPFIIACSTSVDESEDLKNTITGNTGDIKSDADLKAGQAEATHDSNADIRSDEDLKAEQAALTEKVFDVVETMPKFPGGEQARIKYFSENVKYPEKARQNGTQGTVFVQFVVWKDGSIRNVELIRGIGDGCDEETIRVVSEMPKWEPGRDENGKAVNVKFALPVKFKLS